MTWNAHSSVGVAQSVFYAPALLVAAYLLFFKHGRPKTAWSALTVFTTVRIIGGIVLVLYTQHPDSVGYIIAALVFQGTGVIPLILCTVGLLRIIKFVDFASSKRFAHSVIALRVVFLIAIALVVAGSCLIGNYKDASSVSIGTKLAKAGYICLAGVVAGVVGFDAWLWSKRPLLTRESSVKILTVMTISVPFLVVRITYSCLTVFATSSNDTRWSPLYGSVAALVIMHSIMEYLVVLMYLVVGFSIPTIDTTGKVTRTEGNLKNTETV